VKSEGLADRKPPVITVCKNCGHRVAGRFCPECGQSADTDRLDLNFLIKHLRKVLFKYFDNGILYTSRELFTRPGHSIREYIEGKRVRHFEPLPLLVTIAALYGILYNYFGIDFFYSVENDPASSMGIDFVSVNKWFSKHFALASCILIPVYSAGTRIAFRKQGYNFTEHLALNTFSATQRLLFRLAAFPLLVVLNKTEHLKLLLDLLIIADFLLFTWTLCQFFTRMKLARSLMLAVASYVIFWVIYFALVVLLIFVLQAAFPKA
jgi:ribosomal protein L32